LDEISLQIESKEIIALVGESGSGKTILSRAIMNLIPKPGRLNSGKVLYRNKNLIDLSNEELADLRGNKIATIVSNPKGELDPLETIGQQISNVIVHHLRLTREEAKKKAIQLLKDVKIPDPERRFDAYPHELSGGMAQRVIIAISLACDPEIVISDDATSGLDVTVQAQILDLLKDLVVNKGSSLIFVTRDLGVAAHFADRVCVLFDGKIVEDKSTVDFFKGPKNEYAKELLSASKFQGKSKVNSTNESSSHTPVENKAPVKEQLLTVSNLVKHFPIAGSSAVVQAVNDVSFSLSSGETLALVGESGSGKTTIGRTLLGLEKVTAGSIDFIGKKLGQRRSFRDPDLIGKIQLVFQEPAEALNPKMTLYEIVSEPLKNLKSNGNNFEKTVRESFDRVGISASDMNKYPNEISMGFQQRVGIARAIVSNPRLIILDEPTSALDPTARAEIMELLIQIQKELSTSYLFITHDLSAAKHISHKIAILYLGKIIEQGNAERIFASPRHPYSLGLLSSVLLPSTSVKRPTSVSLDGEIPSPINLPTGCSLKSRCPFREELCENIPETVYLSDNHVVHACKPCLIKTEKIGMIKDYFEKFELENSNIGTS
tara:strand:+ start:4823 stop:6634 length:1812 start_codon:yes stop_codon:yes gene_type:complete